MTVQLLLSLLACGGGGSSATDGTSSEAPSPQPPAAEAPAPGKLGEAPSVNRSAEPPLPDAAITADVCDEAVDGGPLMEGSSCITQRVSCGDTVKGHTVGGTKQYDSRWYQSNFCTPATTNHDGGDERIYVLSVPEGDHTAVITMDTPCADLDLAAFAHEGKGGECAEKAERLRRCEMNPKKGTTREHVKLVSQKATEWWIVVEGKNDEEGAFSLDITCRDGLI